jgi:hypothetical protein
MKTKLLKNNATNHQQNSQIIQLSNLTELTDQEAALVIGGGNIQVYWNPDDGGGSSDGW